MSKYIEAPSNEQMSFFNSLDCMVSEESVVRIIDEIVNQMNIDETEFNNNSNKTTVGRPKHNPILLLKLYIYSYFIGIRSSRKIEKECARNIEAMWLMNKIVPDHKCISDFRKNNSKVIKKVFKEFLVICDLLGLLGKKLVAIDGTKIRANNSKNKCYTKNKLTEMLNYFEKKVAEYERVLEENDKSESKIQAIELDSTSIKTIKEKLEETKQKIEDVTKQKSILEEENINQTTITDPDSRLMKSANKGFDVSYNAQIAVDSSNHFIVATDVTNEVSDVEQLKNMTDKVTESIEIDQKEIITIVADKGYYSADSLLSCEGNNNLNIIVSVPSSSSSTKNPKYNIDNFIYNAKDDNYKCPEGMILSNTSRNTSKEQVYKNVSACQNCKHKEQCTKAACREIIRNEKSSIREKAKEKLTNNIEIYKKRQQLVEHPFGTMKRSLGFTHFLTRGLENVKTENFLHALAYNFKRLINIIKNKGSVYNFSELMTQSDITQ